MCHNTCRDFLNPFCLGRRSLVVVTTVRSTFFGTGTILEIPHSSGLWPVKVSVQKDLSTSRTFGSFQRSKIRPSSPSLPWFHGGQNYVNFVLREWFCRISGWITVDNSVKSLVRLFFPTCHFIISLGVNNIIFLPVRFFGDLPCCLRMIASWVFELSESAVYPIYLFICLSKDVIKRSYAL